LSNKFLNANFTHIRQNVGNMKSEVEKESAGKFFVPTLTIVFFAVTISTPMLSLLQLDMAKTFFPDSFVAGTSQAVQRAAVGIIAQTSTVNSVFEAAFALVMGALVVRFKHKSLLLVGVLLLFISAIGSFYAPTLPILQVFYALEGAATIMVGIMGLTMVGEFLPSQKKAKTVGYLVAATSLSTLIGIPLIGLITSFGGWRLNFMLFVLPVSVLGLILAFITLPQKSNIKPLVPEKNAYLTSFKQVLMNKFAVSCLIGGMLGSAVVVGLFAVTFYRQQFGVSLGFATGIMLVAALMYVVASLVVGRLVGKTGAKKLTVISALGNGILTMIFFFMPNLWIALPLDMVHVWFGAAAFTAFSCLALDQVPQSRGTMMSMKSMFLNIGTAIGAAVGGAMLILFGSYQAVGIALGAISVASGAVFYFLTKDPDKP
jgi:predicted MFS family arabinose efflux permease